MVILRDQTLIVVYCLGCFHIMTPVSLKGSPFGTVLQICLPDLPRPRCKAITREEIMGEKERCRFSLAGKRGWENSRRLGGNCFFFSFWMYIICRKKPSKTHGLQLTKIRLGRGRLPFWSKIPVRCYVCFRECSEWNEGLIEY